MRPIHLTMTAFGPFAAKEEIRFSDLGKNPLFLINGPTGAGKSTILDAICFALYGETTGNEREGRQMRSDQAAPDLLTEVNLTFELASGIYRITRIPEQFRPKSRGDGFTEQKARAELYQIKNGQEDLLAAPKVTEVNAEIIRLTGLSVEQFRQVMVLPQGKFRELLLAKSEDREEIFESLFQTNTYRLLQVRLREQANLLLSQLKEIRIQQSALLDNVQLHNTVELTNRLKHLEQQIQEVRQQKDSTNEEFNKAQQTLQQARLLQQHFSEYETLSLRYSQLQVKQEEMANESTRLKLSRKARGILPAYQGLLKNRHNLQELEERVANSRTELANKEEALQDFEKRLQSILTQEKRIETLQSQLINFENFEKYGIALREVNNKLDIASTDLNSAGKVLQDLNNQLAQAKQSLLDLDNKYRDESKAVTKLAEKRQSLQKLEDTGKQLRQLQELQKEKTGIQEQLNALRSEEKKAANQFEAVTRQCNTFEITWRHAQAAILAAQLKLGEKCPVCGSEQHPELAQSESALLSEQDVNQAREAQESARRDMENIKNKVMLVEQKLKTQTEHIQRMQDDDRFDSSLNLNEVRHQYAELNSEIQLLQNVSDSLLQLEQNIAQQKQQIIVLETQLEQERSKVLNQEKQVAALQAEKTSKEQELPEKYRDSDLLSQEIRQAKQEIEQLKHKIQQVQQAHKQALESRASCQSHLNAMLEQDEKFRFQLVSSEQEWIQKLADNQFVDEQAFHGAILEMDVETSLEKQIRQYEDDLLVTQKEISAKQLLIKDKVKPEIELLEQVEEKSRQQKEIAETRFHAIQHESRQLQNLSKRLIEFQKRQMELEEQYGLLGKLSDICNGKNPHNLSLQRFVLSVLLDDVLTEASFRLHKMSNGRYQLYRKESVEDRRNKAGLEITVEDAYTGRQRPAATLSGGESFLAALALALGLSDVVQAYAGGIRLDTLFIDEGFGSLDPESLELAINTLMNLRDSGRMIGIISHVEELKRMIDVRLDVVSNKGISHAKLTGFCDMSV